MPQVGFILFENADRATAMAQTKFASIAASGRQFTNHEGTSKPSLPDYEALIAGAYSPSPWSEGVFGGSPGGRDGPAGIAPGYWGSQANLFTQLQNAGHSWKGYEEGVNGPGGYTTWGNAGTGSLHVARHCPAAFFTATNIVGAHPGNGRYDFDELAADITAGTLPDFFFITPNLVNNGHNSGLAPANTWLQNGNGGSFPGYDALLAKMRSDGVLILTFDNIPTADTTVPITGTGVVYCVVTGPNVAQSTVSAYSHHMSLPKAVQSVFGVSSWSTGVNANYTSAPAMDLSTATTGPSAPVITAPTQNQVFSGTSVTVTWNAATGGTAPLTYQINRGDGLGFVSVGSALTDTATYAQGSWAVSVQAVDAASHTSPLATINFQTGVVVTAGAPLITVAYNNNLPRFVNAAGDQVLLRGVNLQADASSTLTTIAAGMGLNMVRIVCGWDSFEATAPTGTGSNYSSYVHTLTSSALSGLDAMAKTLASNGIYMQIDFHQASWSPYFGGFHGVPSWYYTDNRFKPNQNGGSGWATTAQSSAINAWWTDAQEKPMAQTLYNAFVSKMVSHVLASSYASHVVGYQVFNEPNPGSMSGSSQAKTSVMQAWLNTTVNTIHGLDSARAIFVMCHGGGQGYGDATFTDAFGSIATMQSKNMAMEYHSYYTGQLPGHDASGTGTGYGSSTNNDEYFPNSDACHNTPAGSSYTGSQAGQEGFISVPLAKAAAIKLPFFQGEMGVLNTDPGRLNYIKHYQAVMDENDLSGVVWLLASTPGSDSLNLVTSGVLNDMGTAWKKWFQATTFVIPSGGGPTGPTPLSAPVINASTLVDGQNVNYTAGTYSGAVSVTGKWQVSPTGDVNGTDWTDAP